jgi:quinol monooxygenase YgiN
MVVVHARVHAIASGRDAVARAIRELTTQARRQEGCVSYLAAEMLDEPGEFLVVGAWDDESAMRAHYDGAAYGRFAADVTPLLAQPSDTAVYMVSEPLRPIADLSSEPLRQD